MADWATISSLATAVGTLVLALATFASTRSNNRTARASERALLISNRPLLVSSHIFDPEDKIRFRDDRWVSVAGGHAYAGATEDSIYFVISLRNTGNGPAVLDRWQVTASESGSTQRQAPDTANYRRLTRDLYIGAGDTGLWQGAIRDPGDPDFASLTQIIANHDTVLISIEYSDQDGGQHIVSHFALTYRDNDVWLTSTVRHWHLDSTDPR
jgi:hypothetical protein